MSFHKDLLNQAVDLSTPPGPGRPLQANLRRAVSAAYYALFHLLVDESSHMLIRGTSMRELRSLVSRAFNHGEMKDCSKAFASGGLHPRVQRTLGTAPLSDDLKLVAQVFVELQEARHKADYDLSTSWNRNEVRLRIKRAEYAFLAWDRIRNGPEAKVYLTGLLLNRKWNR